MAIERKHKGTGNNITQPGEYLVTVIEVKTMMSKKDKPMCVVTFETAEEQKINGYYVRDLKFHMAALNDLKVACGLAQGLPADALVGRKCGIAVGNGKARDDGSHFMSIEGYGKPEQVEQSKGEASFGTYGSTAHLQDMEVPF